VVAPEYEQVIVSFGVNAERLMPLDEFAFDAVAFVAGATATLFRRFGFAR